MIIIDNDKIVKNNDDTVRVLITSFPNIVSDLKILDYNNCDRLARKIQESVSKAIVKYWNHTSMLNIGEVCKKDPQFYFRCVDEEQILKEI